MLLKLIFGGVVSAAPSTLHAVRMECNWAIEVAVIAFDHERELLLKGIRLN